MFTVAPMNHKIDLKAGEVYHGEILVSNPANSETDFEYIAEVTPYSVTGTSYDADLATESQRSMITKWIKIEEPTGTLKPNDKKVIKFTITVPENVPAGGQYAAITVRSNDDSQATDGFSVKNIFEIASVIYAEIDGEITHKGEVTNNNIPGFVTGLPIHLDAMITNEGNVHETASVELKVKNVLTGDKIYPEEGQTGILDEVIMPESTRYLVRDVTNVAPLGVYEVTQSINYLGEVSSETRVVFACPIWFLIALVFTAGLIIYGIIRAILKHRRRF
ncbi:hypothetical protein IJ101_02850 [Candidatus Saccharibacteria bacterium]|nr:hypothetical protein [Candidatus Saccharibacteria bacterium]